MTDREKLDFLDAAYSEYGNGGEISRDDIKYICEKYSHVKTPHWLINDKAFRIDRGIFRLPTYAELGAIDPREASSPEKQAVIFNVVELPEIEEDVWEDDPTPGTLIPRRHPGYVPFGFYDDLIKIIENKLFFPIFISGWSGNGKTLMAEQVVSKMKRELIRVNISPETDATDLLGGPTLIEGNVVYREGPVLIAMKRGAVLLLDEVDRGSAKLLCLQGILEGKPYYNKFTNELIYPAEGFNIIATANTKGRGSEEGKYLAQILDDAFLERFALTVEQEFPPKETEQRILLKEMKRLNLEKPEDKEFASMLVDWAKYIRASCNEGACNEILSTRRLVFICQSYSIFGERAKAIQYCINKFDDIDKTTFMDFYEKIDEKVALEKARKQARVNPNDINPDLPRPDTDESLDEMMNQLRQNVGNLGHNQGPQMNFGGGNGGGPTGPVAMMPTPSEQILEEDIIDPEKWKPVTKNG